MADAFCAICCGPMTDIRIATKPRSEAFKAAAQRGDSRGENKDIYDCEIISKEDTAWTETIMLLGFNPKAKEFTKQVTL